MKKAITLFVLLMLCFCAFSCTQENNGELDNENNNGIISTDKIKLLGDIIPRPALKYDVINSSDESVYLEVKNATETDFRNYVDSCRSYGFDGEIMSAEFPDYYYREYNGENYFLEVRFMEKDQEFSIYIRKPTN